jgi:hypothetical protein
MKVLQRVVWNTAGWRRPTATSNEGDYLGSHGFGHEEWNFQADDAVDGDVLGYLWWKPGAKTQRDSGGSFDIGFWVIHPETRRRMLVGYYTQARLADEPFMRRVHDEFDQRRIFGRRAEELRAAVPSLSKRQAATHVREGVERRMMRFRCPVDRVVALEPAAYIEVPARLQNGGLSLRFASPTFVGAFPTGDRPSSEDDYARMSPLVEDAYFREVGAQMKTIIPLHNALSNAFASWLRAVGFANVRQEQSRVDVEFGPPAALHRAELKTCHCTSSTKAIREALGQLFEYNHYGVRAPARTWWIVIDNPPTSADLAFLAVLRRTHDLPLVLAWPDGAAFSTDVAMRPA